MPAKRPVNLAFLDFIIIITLSENYQIPSQLVFSSTLTSLLLRSGRHCAEHFVTKPRTVFVTNVEKPSFTPVRHRMSQSIEQHSILVLLNSRVQISARDRIPGLSFPVFFLT
jgi:hypothetical protein